MERTHSNRHTITASELKERLEAERTGRALLVYRDGEGHQRILVLPAGAPSRITVGRGPAADLRLAWDREVSRSARGAASSVGGEWAVSDDGLSTNGTFRNDERVHGRQRLSDGDQLRFGQDDRRVPRAEGHRRRHDAAARRGARRCRSRRRSTRVVALCRPLRDNPYATPATNSQIASEMHLGVDAIKVHLRALYRRLGIEDAAAEREARAAGRARDPSRADQREGARRLV